MESSQPEGATVSDASMNRSTTNAKQKTNKSKKSLKKTDVSDINLIGGKNLKRKIESTDEESPENQDNFLESGEEEVDNNNQDADQSEEEDNYLPKKTRVHLVTNQEVIRLKECNHKSISAFKEYIQTMKLSGAEVNRNELILPTQHLIIELSLEAANIPNFQSWKKWSDEELFRSLLQACPRRLTASTLDGNGGSVEDRVRALKFNLNFHDITSIH